MNPKLFVKLSPKKQKTNRKKNPSGYSNQYQRSPKQESVYSDRIVAKGKYSGRSPAGFNHRPKPPIEMGIERIEIEIEKLGPFRRPAQGAYTGGQEARQEVPKSA